MSAPSTFKSHTLQIEDKIQQLLINKLYEFSLMVHCIETFPDHIHYIPTAI